MRIPLAEREGYEIGPMIYRRLIAWVIRLVGTMELLAFGFAFMPYDQMQACYELLGRGEMPSGPVFESVMRQVSFTYGLHGIGMWLIAFDLARYRPFVWLTCAGYLVAAPAFVAFDLTAGMPVSYVIGNGGSCLLVGGLLLGLILADRPPVS